MSVRVLFTYNVNQSFLIMKRDSSFVINRHQMCHYVSIYTAAFPAPTYPHYISPPQPQPQPRSHPRPDLSVTNYLILPYARSDADSAQFSRYHFISVLFLLQVFHTASFTYPGAFYERPY